MDSNSSRAESPFVQDNSVDQVIFWSAEYEEQLLMDHGLGELAARLYPANPDPADPAESKPDDVLDWAIDGVPISFNTSMEMPLLVLDEELPMPNYSGSYKASPNFRDEIPMLNDVDSIGTSGLTEVKNKFKDVDAPRRGRPAKSTSSSRMAQYSRFYREMKKSQLQDSEKLVAQLREENRDLREENRRMIKGFRRMEEELMQLRHSMGGSRPVKAADWLI